MKSNRLCAFFVLLCSCMAVSAQTSEYLGKMQGRNHKQKGHAYQGMDVWGEYVFSCQNQGIGTIYKLGDKDFEKVIQRPITLIETARPYDLNTPMREYKTCGGKSLFGLIVFVFKCLIKFASLGKDSDDKQTKIKNYYFAMRTIQTMSLRSLSYASEGMLTHRMALGLLDIANNKPFKGLGKLITKEKCVKLPK